MGHFARECHQSRECKFLLKKMVVEEEDIIGEVVLHLRILTDADIKDTKEEEATAVTEIGVALLKRKIASTVLATVTKRGRKSIIEEAILLMRVEDDGTME